MINIIVFFFSFFILLSSTIGYGILFKKLCFNTFDNHSEENLIFIGFYGLFFLTLISLISNLFFSHSFLHNIILHGVGLFSLVFLKVKEKRIYLKYIFIISLFTFSALLISKTNDDFSYYHLPFTKYLTEHKIIFGMGHLNHGYNLLSSLFFLNSLFYLPKIEFYSFQFTILFFLIFFNFFVLKEIFYSKNHEIIKILYVLSFTYFNLSFNRLAEFGTDKPGQLLIVILVIKLLQIISFERKENQVSQILFLIPLLAYCITLKTYFISYIIMTFVIFILQPKIKYVIKNIFFSKPFLFFSFSLLIYFLHHFISTGCLISPLSITCLGDYFNWSWARETRDMTNLSIWLEQWAKAGAGPNFRVNNVSEYISHFNWIHNWIHKYFLNKFLDQLLILFSSFVVIFLLSKSFSFKKERNNIHKNIFYFYSLIIIIFLIWFFNHPTLRYGGYSIVFLTLSIPISLIFFKYKNNNNFTKRAKFLVLFVIIVFNLKNITRVDKEFNRGDHYKFTNFPFFSIKKKNFEKYESKSGLNIYSAHHCWATPTPCGNIDKKIYINKKNNYYFINKEK